jgi:archaellum component FlaC
MSDIKKIEEEIKELKKEKSWHIQLAEQIAGDNEMLKNLIKAITHPIVLFGGMVGFFYWMFSGQKKEVEKFKEENKEMKENLKKVEKKLDELKTDYEKLKEEFQKGKENFSGLGNIHQKSPHYKVKRYSSTYLD